jgi:putative metallohydrolase (TIGR04338 family)
MRDSQREKVYQAEYRLREFYDTAERIGNPMVVLDGIPLTLPPEAKFASIESIQRYVDLVVGRDKIAVRARKGVAKAHMEAGGVMAIPDQRLGWAMREIVVLHEIAHHLAPGERHGPGFTAKYGQLLAETMGPETGLMYRILCSHAGAK